MAGEAPLTGERAHRAMRMLRHVTDILDGTGVGYWLESGTLLGIVRERRLLPWDTDMDIAIRGEDYPRLKKCIASLWLAGYRLRMKRHTVNTAACMTGTPRLLKVRNRKRLFFRGDLLLDVFINFKANDSYHWSIGRDNFITHLSAPAHFYDRLDTIEFDGKRYPVPSNHEDYLAYRYGNWRVPVKRWDCFADDHAIQRTAKVLRPGEPVVATPSHKEALSEGRS